MIRESVILALSRCTFEYAIKILLMSGKIPGLWRTKCNCIL